MGYLEYLLRTPYSWVALAGLLAGAAVSRMTTPAVDSSARARGMKWAGVYLLLALAVVSGTLAVFVPDSSLIRDVGLAYQFVGALVIGALGFRFRLIAGSVVFLLVVAVAVLTVLMRQYWTPVSPGESVAVVRVLAQSDGRTTLEFVAGDDPSAVDSVSIIEVSGMEFAVTVASISCSPHYFFFGMGGGVRFEELLGAGGAAFQFPDAEGPSARLRPFLSSWNLPGMRLGEATAGPVPGRVLQRYEVIYHPDDGLEIRTIR